MTNQTETNKGFHQSGGNKPQEQPTGKQTEGGATPGAGGGATDDH